MISYHARNDILNQEIDAVWKLPDGPIRLVMDDIEIVTTMRETIYSRYIWELHKVYPGTPLLARHHITGEPNSDGEYDDKRLSPTTHLDLLSKVIVSLVECFGRDNLDFEHISKRSYEITNMIYNDMTYRLEAYVVGLNILDFIEVTEHDAIKDANETLKSLKYATDREIGDCKTIIRQTLNDDPRLRNNPVAKSARSGLVSIGQIVQCVGPRGAVTDGDSRLFPHPIRTGYAQGLTRLRDSITDSRTATKALYHSKRPMQDSEYLNRNLQLSAETFTTLHYVDCGSTNYLDMTISNSTHLRDMVGMFYLDPVDNVLKAIRKTDSHLYGKTIKVRSTLSCIHPDPYGCCVVCFGELGYSIPVGTNLGHISTTELQGKVGQKLLQTKHEDSDNKTDSMSLDEVAQNYFHASATPNQIIFNPSLKLKGLKFTIAAAEAPNLQDVHHASAVEGLQVTRITSIQAVQFIFLDPVTGFEMREVVNVGTGQRPVSLSTDMLIYASQHGWDVSLAGDYIIDVTHWDKSKPVFESPPRSFSTVEYMNAIEAFLKGRTSDKAKKQRINISKMIDYPHDNAALGALHDLVSSKLKVPVSHLQTVMSTMKVTDIASCNYNLPTDRVHASFGLYQDIMFKRSLAAFMAFETQANAIYSPISYLAKDRPKHPLDPLLMGY